MKILNSILLLALLCCPANMTADPKEVRVWRNTETGEIDLFGNGVNPNKLENTRDKILLPEVGEVNLEAIKMAYKSPGKEFMTKELVIAKERVNLFQYRKVEHKTYLVLVPKGYRTFEPLTKVAITRSDPEDDMVMLFLFLSGTAMIMANIFVYKHKKRLAVSSSLISVAIIVSLATFTTIEITKATEFATLVATPCVAFAALAIDAKKSNGTTPFPSHSTCYCSPALSPGGRRKHFSPPPFYTKRGRCILFFISNLPSPGLGKSW